MPGRPASIGRRLVTQREFGLLAFIAVVFVVMGATNSVFLNSANLLSMLEAMATTGTIAIGMTVLLVGGGFDLSVGSVAAFVGVFLAELFQHGVPLSLAILIALIAGLLIGLINGLLIAKVGLNPLVTTLGGLSLYRGLTYIITNGTDQAPTFPHWFNTIGQSSLLGIQLPIWYMVILVIVGDLLLRRARLLRRYYYIGGNEKAARLLGIPVDRMKIGAYVLTALLAAVAGVVYTSRVGAATDTAQTGLELQVITAVVIGGASLSGGEGTVSGAALGCLLLVMITNVLNLLNVSVFWEQFTTGAVLLIAVSLDRGAVLLRQRAARRSRIVRRTTDVASTQPPAAPDSAVAKA